MNESEFEALRDKEQDVLRRLLGTLREIETGDPAHVERVQDALFHTDHPYLIMLVGAFNSGKSSIINALLGRDLLPTGATPTTDRIGIIRYGDEARHTEAAGELISYYVPANILRDVSFIDTPGLESVFTSHEGMTRRYVHRSDAVWVVMLATHAMSAGSLDVLRELRDYDKPVKILISQIDLVDADERETVRAFVERESRKTLSEAPEIWMVSAKWALEAESHAPDDEKWAASGFDALRRFIDEDLEESARHAQKLETPLAIAERAAREAHAIVEERIAKLKGHRANVANIRQQIEAATLRQQRVVHNAVGEVESSFDAVERRSRRAIREIFRFRDALSLIGGGLAEAVGLGWVQRRLGKTSRVEKAFDEYDVHDPLANVPPLLEGIGPRLEEEDLRDVSGLADYARSQVRALPDMLSDKLIGAIEVPAHYNRDYLVPVQEHMRETLHQARQVETARMDRGLREGLIWLVIWQIAVIAFAVLSVAVFAPAAAGPVDAMLFVLVLAGLVTGFTMIPLRGLLLAREYERRLAALCDKLTSTLQDAARSQLNYSLQIREATVLPYTRLVDSLAESSERQERTLEAQLKEMAALRQEIAKKA